MVLQLILLCLGGLELIFIQEKTTYSLGRATFSTLLGTVGLAKSGNSCFMSLNKNQSYIVVLNITLCLVG